MLPLKSFQYFEIQEDDRNFNVYDEKYMIYLNKSLEELGLTSEVEPNLALHPYRTNYYKISNLNPKYVMKNLKEAQKFLRDEESYSYRNIYERCHFLLCESSELAGFNYSKNDRNLKLARLIFRHCHAMDKLFDYKPEPQMTRRSVES